ncbi:MAG: aldehyde dehydrogenase family protein [Desulfuromonadales bacterium]|nr:aldehyde dehydrogenase family protein [Desulfuromonadales bacterium]
MSGILQEVDTMVQRARQALDVMKNFTQKQVDAITEAMSAAGAAAAGKLAEMAVAETGMGKVEDKAVKNYVASQVVYEQMKNEKSVGIIEEKNGVIHIAEPFGIVAAVTPTTNPTSTILSKALMSLKGRNVIIFAFHPRGQNCGAASARIMLDAAIAAGAPTDCIQWIKTPSIEATNILMRHPGIAIIIATGGGAMVKAAYSSGHPALGVGPGNVPVYVEKSADLSMAVNNIIASKTFDYGTLCLTEQSVIFDNPGTADQMLKLFKERGAFICDHEQKTKLEAIMFDKEKGVPSGQIVGQSPQKIAELAGFRIPGNIKLLMIPLKAIGHDDWMSHEKLSPVLGWYIANGKDEAINASVAVLEFGGAGHTAVAFSKDEKILEEYALRVPAGRVIWNQPSLHGVCGLTSGLSASLTLGCGARGGNITTENVSYKNLLNIKRVARRIREDA